MRLICIIAFYKLSKEEKWALNYLLAFSIDYDSVFWGNFGKTAGTFEIAVGGIYFGVCNFVNLLEFFFVVCFAIVALVCVLTGNIDSVLGTNAFYFVFNTIITFETIIFYVHDSIIGADFSIARKTFDTFQASFGAGYFFAIAATGSRSFAAGRFWQFLYNLVNIVEVLLAVNFSVSFVVVRTSTVGSVKRTFFCKSKFFVVSAHNSFDITIRSFKNGVNAGY